MRFQSWIIEKIKLQYPYNMKTPTILVGVVILLNIIMIAFLIHHHQQVLRTVIYSHDEISYLSFSGRNIRI